MEAEFEHLCRICAANTKSKTNSVVESVFIFKTQGLKDKISRHLYLSVDEDDPLPKVLCKACYRQVEATASLSNIAKHTQVVFRDFLLSTLPKNAREAAAAQLTAPPPPAQKPRPGPAARTEDKQPAGDESRPIVLTRIPKNVTVTKTQADDPPQSDLIDKSKEGSRETVSVNFDKGGPPQEKVVSARRSSVFVDSRYGSAPMSIAQRSMKNPPSLVPLHSEVSITSAPKISPEKKPSPAGVINFIQTHGRITGKVPVTSQEAKNPQPPPVPALARVSNPAMPKLPTNVLQQKRRNLKNAVNNIKAIQSGQVSLLKSAQARGPVEETRPYVTTTLVPKQTMFGFEPSVEEVLPEHMIFAAPKKKRDDEEATLQTGPPKLAKIMPVPNNPTAAVHQAPCSSNASSPVKSLTEAISLGSVIRDPDLLKLILKALKWPVSAGNCEDQMNRLKNSKFAVIMSDSNLLQDTDLTQLLGPYLAPMLALAQQQEKQSPPPLVAASFSASSSSAQGPKDILNLADLSGAIPYKLPPETSVQLVPSSPTELEPPPLRLTKLVQAGKRSQRKGRSREGPARGPSLPRTSAPTANAAHVTNELLNLNSTLLSQFESNPADALNEALLSMLKQQQEAKEQRSSRRRRSASNSVVNLEDIVLVEPQPPLDLEPIASNVVHPEASNRRPPPLASTQPTPVTRPIVKRRKTVIQSLKPSDVPTPNNGGAPMAKSASKVVHPTVAKTPEKDTAEVEPTSEEQPVVEPSQAPSSTVPEATNADHDAAEEQLEVAAEDASDNADTESSNRGGPGNRKSEVKAVLGQKLLEAIGLPQLGKDVAPESSRDSLRSALKRSLKQAQEQQQQMKRTKHEEPVKQPADSTTKPSAAESADERKKAIAERELALLKRKVAEDPKEAPKDEKSERTDVSSSSSRNRRNRKSKTDEAMEDSGDEEKKPERWDDDDELPLKADGEKGPEERSSSSNSNRPTRASKTQSKYYKGPSLKSQHSMGTRSTRQR
ncbi:uncharacterized protein Dana_GF15049 [Drosophila ananassae]|uniref:ZAD domain-containing protein n=1 Tax=Drosophila ananassae TaxID=7217 RepID=B3MLU2_DROAN|nr:uncharacterized protein LOC6497863 [Drosophila ananassae]EDV30813.1 uncharacterized protein Dana_GF15049 [Drosophila ananassae]